MPSRGLHFLAMHGASLLCFLPFLHLGYMRMSSEALYLHQGCPARTKLQDGCDDNNIANVLLCGSNESGLIRLPAPVRYCIVTSRQQMCCCPRAMTRPRSVMWGWPTSWAQQEPPAPPATPSRLPLPTAPLRCSSIRGEQDISSVPCTAPHLHHVQPHIDLKVLLWLPSFI